MIGGCQKHWLNLDECHRALPVRHVAWRAWVQVTALPSILNVPGPQGVHCPGLVRM